jgi:hypothetical protein
METERPDALFKDPFARRMAGERGKVIAASIPFGQTMAWSIVARTAADLSRTLADARTGAGPLLVLSEGLLWLFVAGRVPMTLAEREHQRPRSRVYTDDAAALPRDCGHKLRAWGRMP